MTEPPTTEGISLLIVRGKLDLNNPCFRNVSRLAKDLLSRMLQVDEAQRITID
jgi:hypothetical protein